MAPCSRPVITVPCVPWPPAPVLRYAFPPPSPAPAQIDRHEDMLRSCLRAVDALNQLGAGGAVQWQAFLRRTVMVPPLREKLAAVERERLEAEGGQAGDAMDLS